MGYCGPEDTAALRAVASGGGDPELVPALARRFTGAWPYQQLIADLTSRSDPLCVEVVRAYWTGNDLTDSLDREEFGVALLDRFGPGMRASWPHLEDSLLPEVAPTHAFHVLSLYPWSRLLSTGRPEPLTVLDSCRIGWGTVTGIEGDRLVVRSRHLEYDDRKLALGASVETRVPHRVEDGSFVGRVMVGDHVALHWGLVCDRLTPQEAADLERWTQWQLAAIAPRLAGP